jgi:hypothetical protein
MHRVGILLQGGSAVTVMVQLEPTLEARLLAEARAQGVPLEAYLASVIAQVAAPKSQPETTSTDFEAGLDELAEGSERLPVLPPEAYRRDGIYGDD